MKTDPLLQSWRDAAMLAIVRSVADALGARRASSTFQLSEIEMMFSKITRWATIAGGFAAAAIMTAILIAVCILAMFRRGETPDARDGNPSDNIGVASRHFSLLS